MTPDRSRSPVPRAAGIERAELITTMAGFIVPLLSELKLSFLERSVARLSHREQFLHIEQPARRAGMVMLHDAPGELVITKNTIRFLGELADQMCEAVLTDLLAKHNTHNYRELKKLEETATRDYGLGVREVGALRDIRQAARLLSGALLYRILDDLKFLDAAPGVRIFIPR